MQFKTVEEFRAQTGKDKPSQAEEALIKACRAGEPCILSTTRPTSGTDANTIRARLLRLLILGGTTECGVHERGVTVVGAWVTDSLDLAYCTARGQTALDACHFFERTTFTSAKLNLLSLEGSHIPGLFAQGMEVSSSVFLRNLTATGTVDLNAAKIGGQLDCTRATLNGEGQMALNAQGVETQQHLFLRKLTATGRVDVNGAKIGGQLDCTGATLNGEGQMALNAQGVETGQSVFLTNLTATGTVDVNSAKISGQLSCIGATLNDAGGKALNAQGVETGEDLFLINLTATGTVQLNGAKIGGQLDCTVASLNGAGGKALNGQRIVVSAGLFFREVKSVIGQVDLTAAHVGDLVDDMISWPKGADDLILDGFTYDRISGAAPVILSARRDWLRIGSSFNGDFFPQPYTQFARTLRAMGHPIEARRVMIEANVQRAQRDRETLRYKRALQRRLGLFSHSPNQENWDAFVEAAKTMPNPARDWAKAVTTRFNAIHHQPIDLPKAPPPLPAMTMALARKGFQNDMRRGALWCQIRRFGNKLWNGFLHRTVGFGYAPQNSIYVLVGLICAAFTLAHLAWEEGSFAPNSDVILTSPEWTGIAAQGCVVADTAECLPNPAATWSAKNAPGMDWDSFHALAYAADLVVPLIDLGQTRAWAPSKDRGPLGWLMWWGRWFFIIAGWVVASLGLAAVTGFVQKNAPD